MSQHRALRCYEYVNRPFSAVHDLLHRDPLELLRSATASASERASELAGSLKVELAGVQLAVKVNLHVHSVRDAEGVAGMSPVTQVSIGWEAAHGASLFPMMSAKLSAWPLTATETQIELEGEYTPPLGSVGQAIDAAVGHRIAEASVRRFLENVVQQIRDDLRERA
jgi:hypothetical protein